MTSTLSDIPPQPPLASPSPNTPSSAPPNNNMLFEKYKLGDNGIYHSITTGSMFENMISYTGGCFQAFDIWKTPEFQPVREIDERLRINYRKNSGGHSGYTFHSLTTEELTLFYNCLASALNIS